MEPQPEAPTPPLPHFDDETTLLTARPVVPIDVAAASKSIRGFLFKAGVVLGAALLGAAVAVFVVSYQNRRAAAAVAESSAPANPTAYAETLNTSKPAAQQSDEPVTSASTTKQAATEDESDLIDTPPTQHKEITPVDGRARRKQSSAGEEAANHKKVVVKRTERAAQRQQAAKVQRSPDADRVIERPRDAGRIQEIFEGPNPF